MQDSDARQNLFAKRHATHRLIQPFLSGIPHSVFLPSALAFAHLSLAAAESLALTAGLLRQSFLKGFALVPFALAQRIFRALARAFMSLRRWAVDM